MKKRNKAFLQMFALWLFFFLFVGDVFAVDTGLGTTAGAANYNTDVSIQTFIGYGIQAIMGVVGAVFFAVLVYGGILWMISNGDEKKIKEARTMIYYSVAGLVVILGGFAIVNFVSTSIADKTLTP